MQILHTQSYSSGSGKYQALYNEVELMIPENGVADSPEQAMFILAKNAYRDYFFNQGVNRNKALKRMQNGLKLKRGADGAKALSILKRFKSDTPALMPKNLHRHYEDIMDAVLEQYFNADCLSETLVIQTTESQNEQWLPVSKLLSKGFG